MHNKNIPQKKIKRIGIFDSGLGGLSIVKPLRNIVGLEYVYVADTAHLPYGDKPTHLIEQYCLDICDYLIYEQQVDLIIIACHTVSSVALPRLQQVFPTIPFIGMVDLVCSSAIAKTKGTIGILATVATINSHKHKDTILSKNSSLKVIEQACPQLVPLLEEYPRNEKNVELALKNYLEEFIIHNVDTIVLGCTHYAMVSSLIQNIYPFPVDVISADLDIKVYLQNHYLFDNTLHAKNVYFATGNPQEFDQKAYQFMGLITQAKQLVINI